MAVYNGRLYAAWKGSSGDTKIWYSTFDGVSWSPQQVIPCTATTIGGSLAVFHGKLCVLYRGAKSDNVWFTSFNGNSWDESDCATGFHSSVGASLAVFRGALHAAGKGVEGDDGIWHAIYDGSTWAKSCSVPTPAATSARPSLAVWNDGLGQKLFMAWKGSNGDERIWHSTFDGSVWTAPETIPNAASSDGPALVLFQGAIYAAWRGPGDDERIWYASYNGTSWTNPELLTNPFAVGSLGPALVVFHDQLYAAWKGGEGDSRILWTRASVMSKAIAVSSSVQNAPTASTSVDGHIGSGKDDELVQRLSDTDNADYGLSDIKRGLKKGIEKGKGDLSDVWSKLKHK